MLTKHTDALYLLVINFGPGLPVVIAMTYYQVDFMETASLYFMVSHYSLRYVALSSTIPVTVHPLHQCYLYMITFLAVSQQITGKHLQYLKCLCDVS